MASIGEDTYNKIFREGKAEGIAESSINTAVYLISKEGWALEKALSVIDIPDGRRDYVIGEIGRRLS